MDGAFSILQSVSSVNGSLKCYFVWKLIQTSVCTYVLTIFNDYNYSFRDVYTHSYVILYVVYFLLQDGWSVLLGACSKHESPEIVEELLKAGANPNGIDHVSQFI